MGVRVMVVDDSGLTRLLLRHIIKQDEHLDLCATAIDGQQAYRLLRVSQPELVVLDLEMPHFDGISFIKDHREGYRGKIVVFSSHVEKHREELESLGVDGFVSKPQGDVQNIAESATASDLIQTIYRVMGIES